MKRLHPLNQLGECIIPDMHRQNQPRKLPADVQPNIQALFDLGYFAWTEGRYKLEYPRDPIYMLGWEQANIDHAHDMSVALARVRGVTSELP